MSGEARDLAEQLDRLEQKLDALLLRRRTTGKAAVKRSTTIARRVVAEVRTQPDEVTRAHARRVARRKGLIR